MSEAFYQKYIDQGFELLPGTETGPSYLVIAKHPELGASVGVKFVSLSPVGDDPASPHIVGLRIRMVPVDTPAPEPTPTENSPFGVIDGGLGQGHKANWKDAYPGLKWENSGDTRRSAVVAIALRRHSDDIHMVPQQLNEMGFYTQAVNFLEASVPPSHWVISPAHLKAFLSDFVEDLYDAYKAQTADLLEAKKAQLIAAAQNISAQLDAVEKAIAESTSNEAAPAYVEVLPYLPDLTPTAALISSLNALFAEQKAKEDAPVGLTLAVDNEDETGVFPSQDDTKDDA